MAEQILGILPLYTKCNRSLVVPELYVVEVIGPRLDMPRRGQNKLRSGKWGVGLLTTPLCQRSIQINIIGFIEGLNFSQCLTVVLQLPLCGTTVV